MSILVVGGTGTLGRQIVRRALDEGHTVRCLVRSYSRASFLREWGAELVGGDICDAETIAPSFAGGEITAVIDAATARATDSLGVRDVDWRGKVNLIQAAKESGVDRYIFLSILNANQFPKVPLMEVKRCTEAYLKQLEMNYTILRPCGFLQGLIGQYAIPILENQSVWVPDRGSPVAYMDTQDIAKFAVRALTATETERQAFPVVGPKAWTPAEIIALCEKLSDRQAKITSPPTGLLNLVRSAARWFKWSLNVADRLAFADVFSSGQPLTAEMAETYRAFGIDPAEISTLEAYLEEYFGRILKKLKQIDYEQSIAAKESKRKKTLRF
ncbi:NAD(P)H-binding protein [Limnothrix sp. FACHB-708]|uniref:NAD(P)H-binding protein n=1 Tax=unclassified Limnothrix TaxID=2632864 RepID=UPI0016896016|nr:MULTISPECIES: NAD(P)H-binding protein [unclassified Limnothrix]MBD2552935.1 NAD(P)H-binding protein [Limnothrix sp. FACHB-708]MBD2589253.1 NAD(P)H-binding protein [Limnothrix sp. FACHB-406]